MEPDGPVSDSPKRGNPPSHKGYDKDGAPTFPSVCFEKRYLGFCSESAFFTSDRT